MATFSVEEVDFQKAFDDFFSGEIEGFSQATSILPPTSYVGLMFGLLGLLVGEKFGAAPSLSVLSSYAKQICDSTDLEHGPSQWLVESVLRVGAGDVEVLGQAQSENLFRSVGLVIREILADLDLNEELKASLTRKAIDMARRSILLLAIPDEHDAVDE